MIDITTGEIIEGSYKKYVALDVHARQLTCSVALSGGGEPHFHGKIENTKKALEKLVKKLGNTADLCFCYEAGCCGYEIYRHLLSMGVTCVIVAPSMIPKRPGDRVKNDRRDSLNLARLLRAGELTSIWVPESDHQAMRDLVRARTLSKDVEKRWRQKISSLLLTHGLLWQGKSNWSKAHYNWLAELSMEHPASRIVLDEYLDALNEATDRVKRFENQIEQFLPEWSLCPLVKALMTMRGISLITACIFVTEVGDLKRFPSPRELMSFLGLVPSEHTSDGKGTRGKITKTGNRFVRKALVESANSYHYPAKKSGPIRMRNEGQPKEVCDIAWKAQVRLCGRNRKMRASGKNHNLVKVAIAREMSGFIWAIGQIVELDNVRNAA